MKNIFSILFASIIYLSASAQSSVLFIGNSYTYVNDLPTMFQSLSANLNETVIVGSKTNGGFTFENHWNDPATFTAIHQQAWDLVIIQGQSQEPSFPTSQVNSGTLPFAESIADSVYASSDCTNLMYYMTWGRETGDPQWDSINTFDKMNERLVNSYMRFADSTNAMVSPVAVAWKYVRDHNPTIQLYSGDGSHPSLAGTYLIACTFYASVFQESPVGATFLAGLDQATAEILQNAAATTVLGSLDLYHLHPINYRTVSNFTWNVNENGLITASSTSIHEEGLDWYINGQHFTTANITYQIPQDGYYELMLVASSDCNNDTLIAPINYGNTNVSTNDIVAYLIYPNPSTGQVHVTGNQRNSLKIYDVNGRFLFETELINHIANLTELANGVYLVEIDNILRRLSIQE